MLLSIIVPCYNVANKIPVLLSTLSTLEESDIELVFVNDGSSDNTLEILNEFKKNTHLPTQVIDQENKGPGGARNTGLRSANGKYIWFVDADDTVEPKAIDVLRKLSEENYDFIDFVGCTGNDITLSIPIKAGSYIDSNQARLTLLKHPTTLPNKCVKRSLLIENKLFYPEYCFYEDNPIALLLPFYTKKFFKSDQVAYYYTIEHGSISHNDINDRYYDRLWTMEWGLGRALPLAVNEEEKNLVLKTFTRIYLINSIGRLMGRWPKPSWIIAMMIMKRYRKILKKHDFNNIDPLQYWKFSLLNKIKFKTAWILSYTLCGMCNEDTYLRNIYRKAWGRDKPLFPDQYLV